MFVRSEEDGGVLCEMSRADGTVGRFPAPGSRSVTAPPIRARQQHCTLASVFRVSASTGCTDPAMTLRAWQLYLPKTTFCLDSSDEQLTNIEQSAAARSTARHSARLREATTTTTMRCSVPVFLAVCASTYAFNREWATPCSRLAL